MSKHKIIIFTTSYHPFVGGAEVAIQEITRRLKERFDFYIITSRFRRDLPKNEVRPEGTVIRIGLGTPFDKWFFPILAPFYYRGSASAVIGVDIGQGSLAAAVLKYINPRVRFILNIQYGGSERDLGRGYLGLHGLLFRFMLSRADYVTAISKYLLDEAKKYGYKGPAEVIHNGVDIRKFTSRSVIASTSTPFGISSAKQSPRDRYAPPVVGARDDRGPVIITTSRLVPKNGIDILIRAIAEVKKTIPDIQCWIIGDGPERKNLELLATHYQLQTNIKFFGEIPHEKITEYLHQADVFARSSRSEGMGNSFVEALAAGLPIIGTHVGGITDIIEDPSTGSGRATGLFCNPEDPKDLAEKIICLLEDRELGKRIVDNGRKMVEERFSWDKIAEGYADLFNYRGSASIGEAEPLRILIATPLLPPQLGGPALYAKNLGEEFKKVGHNVRIVSFGLFLHYPSGIRHLLYFFTLLRYAAKTDIIFALDYTSVGFPAAVAAWFLRKPFIIRVEGDFLWESFVERTRRDITLTEFYQNPPKLKPKERLVKWLSRWVMRQATKLVFSSEWRRKMIADIYEMPSEKTEIIPNAFIFTKEPDQPHRRAVILWAGRMLYLKNLHRLIRAFLNIGSSCELHLIGEGPERENLEKLVREYRAENRIKFFPPMSHKEVMERVVWAKAVVLPSLSDVGPNIVAEAIANLTPVLMTKESGYAEIFRDNVLLIDPLDEADLREKLEEFIKHPIKRIFPQYSLIREWNRTAESWIELFSKI